MANKRIKDLAATATSPANDDFLALDGASNNTRKILATEFVQDDDSRLTDARTPTAHAASHVGSGEDKIRDATSTQDGLMTSAYAGKLDGVAANANNYTHPNHSGDVTSVGDGATTIANDAVTNQKLANVSTNTIKGRATAGTGDPEDLSASQALSVIGAEAALGNPASNGQVLSSTTAGVRSWADPVTPEQLEEAMLSPLTPTFAYDSNDVLQMVVGDIPNSWRDGDAGTQDGLIIGTSATSIGSRAFYDGFDFTGKLTISNSVTIIGDSAFEFCSGFTGNLVIPDSVTTIGSNAFEFCSGFTGNLTIPDSVTTIGNSAFRDCTGFTGNLTIPDSVTTIGSSAFQYCTGITNVNCYVTRTIMNATNCLLGSGVTTINVPASGTVADTWTAGADTIGGKAVTVIKSL